MSSPAGGTASTGSTSAAAPLVIGVMGSFTGVASGSTADAKVLTQDWVSATNASGGINGHPIQAIYLDDLNTPSTALTNAEQLVNQDHVKAILDLSDDQESSWAKVPDAAKVPVIGQAESPTFGTDANFYSVGTTVEPLIWGAEGGHPGQGEQGRRAVLRRDRFLLRDSPADYGGRQAAEHIARLLGQRRLSSAASYTARGRRDKANGATVVAASNTALNVAASCATQGYKPVWVTTAGEMTTPWLQQSAVNGAIGDVQDAPWFDDSIPGAPGGHAGGHRRALAQRDQRAQRLARSRPSAGRPASSSAMPPSRRT